MGYYKNKYSNHNKKKHNAQQGGEKKSKMEKFISDSKTMLESKISNEEDETKRQQYEELLKKLDSFGSKNNIEQAIIKSKILQLTKKKKKTPSKEGNKDFAAAAKGSFVDDDDAGKTFIEISKKKAKTIISSDELNKEINHTKDIIGSVTEKKMNPLIEQAFIFDKINYAFILKKNKTTVLSSLESKNKKKVDDILAEILKLFETLIKTKFETIYKKLRMNNLKLDEGTSQAEKKKIKDENKNMLISLNNIKNLLDKLSTPILKLYSSLTSLDITPTIKQMLTIYNKTSTYYTTELKKQESIKDKTFPDFLKEIKEVSSSVAFEKILNELNDYLNYRLFIQKQFIKNYVIINIIQELKQKKDEFQKQVEQMNLCKIYTIKF